MQTMIKSISKVITDDVQELLAEKSSFISIIMGTKYRYIIYKYEHFLALAPYLSLKFGFASQSMEYF